MSKKRKLSKPRRRPTVAARSSSAKSETPAKSSTPQPIIPFSPLHRILLVGEGDLSFAASLASHHACKNLTATVLEPSLASLSERYPVVAAANADLVTASSPTSRVLYGVDVRKKGPFKPLPGFDRVFFNFPHVGGKSTDLDRQVRYGQELLLAFFARAALSLAPAGAVVVTLFEGEPYAQWNVRDLGRHCGLRVERSFRFQSAAYPGYRHARTLGVVKSKKSGRPSEDAWRGETRPARSYVFVREEDDDIDLMGGGFAPKKRKRRDSSDDEDTDESGG